MRVRFLDDLGLKLVSLVLAIGLWFIIAAEKTSERGVIVPIEVQNIPTGLEITTDTANHVSVRLRAAPGIIKRVGQENVAVVLDLKDFTEGEHILHLTDHTVRRPFGVTVVKVSPSTLTLTLEKSLERDIPVRPRLTGTPAAGMEVAEVRCEPESVRVAGPRSRMERIASVYTEAIPLNGAGTGLTQTTNIGIEDPLLRILDGPRARVIISLREIQEERIITNQPLELRGGQGVPQPARVTVTVKGPRSLVRNLARDGLRPYVSLTAATAPSTRLKVAVDLAPGLDGISVIAVEPSEILVRARNPSPR
ncbi:MAG: CdaR family protein [Vicinamibacteria bacterium]|jgi:YbbR domain-containing protein|nr:CdaR family protein [Vicinamibacteria bacterium]